MEEISDWHVDQDCETLSDHKYVLFKVEKMKKQQRRSRNKNTLSPRWNFKKIGQGNVTYGS